MCDERNSPAADPLAVLEPVEADYTDEVTEVVAAMEPEEWMPEPPVGSMAPDVALAHQRLERALNAHLGGGVEVRADGAIAIESRLIMVETGDLLATGTVVIRRRTTAPMTALQLHQLLDRDAGSDVQHNPDQVVSPPPCHPTALPANTGSCRPYWRQPGIRLIAEVLLPPWLVALCGARERVSRSLWCQAHPADAQ